MFGTGGDLGCSVIEKTTWDFVNCGVFGFGRFRKNLIYGKFFFGLGEVGKLRNESNFCANHCVLARYGMEVNRKKNCANQGYESISFLDCTCGS